MRSLRLAWLLMAILTAAGVLVSWLQAETTELAWWHILGVMLSVLFLVLVWLRPGSRQPTKPPP